MQVFILKERNGNATALKVFHDAIRNRKPFLVNFGHVVGLVSHPDAAPEIRAIKNRPKGKVFSLWGELGSVFDQWSIHFTDEVRNVIHQGVFTNRAFCRFRVKLIVRFFPRLYRIHPDSIANGRVQIWDSSYDSIHGALQWYFVRLLERERYRHLLVTSANRSGQPPFIEGEEALEWGRENNIPYAFYTGKILQPAGVSQQIIEVGNPFLIRRQGNRDISVCIKKYGLAVKEDLDTK